MVKVSIIVPVYNTEDYIRECVNTLVNQTLKDIEIILIDDGSTDMSGKICDELAASDKRIRVIHQINSGQSTARNNGMTIAHGDYIGFVDADDGVHPQMYECLARVLDSTEYPFVHCAFHRDTKLSISDEDFLNDFDISKLQVFSSAEGMLKMMDWKTYGHYVVKGLYRTEYLSDYQFSDGVVFEDVIWSGNVVANAGEYAYVPYDFYTYRMRDESTVHNLSWKTQKMYFEAIKEYVDIAKDKAPNVASQIQRLVYQAIIEKCCNFIQAKSISHKEINEIRKYSKCCDINATIILKSDMNPRRKVIYLLSLLSFSLACRLRNLLIR